MSRWAGGRRGSCAPSLENLAGYWRSSSPAPDAALELRAPLRPGRGTGAALAALRRAGVPGAGPDRWLAPELAAAEALVASGASSKRWRRASGSLE